MDVWEILALVVGVASLAFAAWLHPGRSRAMATVTATLGIVPFVWATARLGDFLADGLVGLEPWKIGLARVGVLAACAGLAILLATIHVERVWPVFPLLLAASLWTPAPLARQAATLVAVAGLGPVTRGGYGDPSRWRRVGAGVSLLALAAADLLVVREALIP